MGDTDSGNSFNDSASISFSGKVMFAAIILLFLAVVFVIFLHLYAKWYWGRNGMAARSQSRRRFVFGGDRDSVLAPRRGLEPSLIQSLPVVIFNPSEFKEGLECAVCLSELAEGEKARLLPICNHGFHLECIDMWFQSHSTCPLCRNVVASSDSSSSPESDEEEIPVPELNSAVGHSTESPNFPTNILFWGTQDQVSTGVSLAVEEGPSSSSASPPTKLEGNGMLVIDVPRQLTDSFSFPSSSSSIRFPEEELKSPTAATRLRSLKRLLSREKRVVPSSPTGADIEQGGNAQSIKAPSDP